MEDFAGPGAPISPAGFQAALDQLDVPAESLWAVLSVETSGWGFLPDRRPKILFERHYFHRLTRGKYDRLDPDISQSTAGGYGKPGGHQYARLADALGLDREAALMSASWGLGQIMGEYYALAGYLSVDAMVAAFVESEDNQLAGLIAFIDAPDRVAALRAQDWASFARLYNGPAFLSGHYGQRLKTAFDRYEVEGAPDLRVRQAQVWLNYLGEDTGGIDGIIGPQTRAALMVFQHDHALKISGAPDEETLVALSKTVDALPV